MVKYYMKSTFCLDGIENDCTDSSENGSQYAFLINPSTWPFFQFCPSQIVLLDMILYQNISKWFCYMNGCYGMSNRYLRVQNGHVSSGSKPLNMYPPPNLPLIYHQTLDSPLSAFPSRCISIYMGSWLQNGAFAS